jgi:hypothetical protein
MPGDAKFQIIDFKDLFFVMKTWSSRPEGRHGGP